MSTITDLVLPQDHLKAMSFGAFGGIMPINYNMIIDNKTIFELKGGGLISRDVPIL